MKTLSEFLSYLLTNWDGIPTRVKQDGKWQSLYLSEIKDGNQILDWIKESKGRFWE